MSFIGFLGPFLLGTGPLISIFCLLIARKSFAVLLSLDSAFYWLTVLLGTSAVLKCFGTLEREVSAHAGALLFSLLVQQTANYGMYRVNKVVKGLLEEAGRKLGHGFTSLDALWVSVGLGFGHGAVQSTFFFVSLLEGKTKDATYYDYSVCPDMSLFTASALLTLGFSLFHTFSTVVFFEGLAARNFIQTTMPVFSHLLAALLTLSNFRKDGCLATIPITLSIGIGYAVWAGAITWKETQRQFPRTEF